MPDPDELVKDSPDRPEDKSADSKPDVVTPEELKTIHEDATRESADRSSFLKDSLGKALSPSTEYLKDMVINIMDGADELVGVLKSDAIGEILSDPLGKAGLGAGKAGDATKSGDATKAGDDVGTHKDVGEFDISKAMTNDMNPYMPIEKLKELGKWLSGDDATAGDKSTVPTGEHQPGDRPTVPTGDQQPAETAKPEEKPEEVLAKFKDDPETKEQREKLEKLAEQKIKDPAELKKFKEDMEAFEKRGAEQKPPLKPEDIKDTYKELSKLMETKDGPGVPIKEGDRVKLAEQVMRQAAHPTDISQGEYNTCNVTTVEVRTYTKNPAEAARMVSDVATTGKYTNKGEPQVTVEVDAESLKRHGQSKDDKPGDNKRTYASQIFEVTAVNLHYKAQHQKGQEDIRYEQREPRPAGPGGKPPADNGERLLNYSKLDPSGKPTEVMDKKNDKIPERNPRLGSSAIADINRQINPEAKDGNQEGPVVIGREPDDPASAARQLELKNQLLGLELKSAGVGDGTPVDLNKPEDIQKTKEAIDERAREGRIDSKKAQELKDQVDSLVKEKNREYRNEKGVVIVHSPEEMEKTLAKMKEEGRLPAIIAVSTAQEPFKSDAGAHATGDIGGGHVVTVTDYHPAKDGKPATVDVDNQWGKSSDRSMTVKELYDAQETPKGPVIEKLESLEKRHAAGDFNGKEGEYEKELQKLYLEELRRWDAAKNTGEQAKETAAIEALKDSLRQLQPSPSKGQKVMQDAIAEFKKEKAGKP